MPDLVALINEATELAHAKRESPFRVHLGASLIGRPCDRELWYTFRWALAPNHGGRILRLFDRGSREEFQFIVMLGNAGVHVLDKDPATGKQWRVADVDGHFGGSLDGIATSLGVVEALGDVIPAGTPFLTEFKTHGTKSFCDLVAQRNLRLAKPEHYRQMQVYMLKRELKHGLYLAVNKNDDDLYAEIVECDPEVGKKMIKRAERIIRSPTPPNRIGKHPSWFECKFCSYSKVCHYGEPMLRNCRTCRHSAPVEDGQWRCGKWEAIIPLAEIIKGCEHHSVITD